MPLQPVIALKVDVDTYIGTRDGVPRLIEILESFGIRATFYFSMGPDNSGKAIRRIFTRKGFLKKMLRTKAPSAYGIKTMLYGTLLPAPMIAASFPEILRQTERKGHETGIHCWDHVKWHDYLPWLPKPITALELGMASALFQEILGHRAKTTAAPGWTVSADSLEIQDALQPLLLQRFPGARPLLSGHGRENVSRPSRSPRRGRLPMRCWGKTALPPNRSMITT